MTNKFSRVCALALLLLPVSLYAQVTIAVEGASATQLKVHVKSSASTCSYRASEGSTFTTMVNDLNTSYYTGANLDSRPGAIVNGNDHYMVIGTRKAQRGLDNLFHSRALQAYTQHYLEATCGGTTVSTTAYTNNIASNATFPEYPDFDGNAFGNVAIPTVDFTIAGRDKTYVDPLTGVLIKRITGPQDHVSYAGTGYLFTTPINVGGSWTNPANATANQSSTTYTTISAPNSALFLPFPQSAYSDTYMNYSGLNSGTFPPSDARINVYGQATGGGVLSICLSVDSGQTCATDSHDVTLSGTFGLVQFPLSTDPNYGAEFASWGIQAQPLSANALAQDNATNISITGNVLTYTGGWKLIANRAPGSKLYVAGSSPTCTNNLCTVVSYTNGGPITLAETFGSTFTGTALDQGTGFRIVLKNTGGSPVVNANFTMDGMSSYQHFGGTNAENYICSKSPITDISTDGAGNSTPTRRGYLCNVGNFAGDNLLYLFIPETGEWRFLSNYVGSGGSGSLVPPQTPFDANPKVLFASNYTTQHVYRLTLGAAPYLTYSGSGADALTYYDLTANSTSVDAQVTAAGGAPAAAMATGLWPAFGFMGAIDGYLYYGTKSSGQDSPCLRARTLSTNNALVDVITSFDSFPFTWVGCHAGAEGSGSIMQLGGNPLRQHQNTSTLGGPFRLNTIAMHRGNNGMVSTTFNVTAATTANPVQLTIPGHTIDVNYQNNYGSGPYVTVSGGTGNWAALNGGWVAHVVDGNNITIPVDSSGFTGSATSLVVSVSPGIPRYGIQSIVAGTPTTVVTTTTPHKFIDGDPIGFASSSRTLQFYAKVTGYTSTTFGLYADAALTVPVSATATQADGSVVTSYTSYTSPDLSLYGYSDPHSGVYLSEMCPSGIPEPLNSGTNLDGGMAGKNRCLTLRVTGEPCSLYATSAEHAAFPCPSDPTNVTKSSLANIKVGDGIYDLGYGSYGETMIVVKKLVGSGYIDITVARMYPNLSKEADSLNNDPNKGNHNPGATWAMVAPGYATQIIFIDANDSTHTKVAIDTHIPLAHSDIGDGYGVDSNGTPTRSYASGFGSGPQNAPTPDSFSNVTVASLSHVSLTYYHNDWTWFGGTAQIPNQSFLGNVQSYPGKRQTSVPLIEHSWKVDWNHYNPSNGGSSGTRNPLISGANTTPVAGMTSTFKISVVSYGGGFDIKHTPLYGLAGRFMMHDISGPGSVINDSTPYSFCHVYTAGECVTGSAVNDVYVSVPNSSPTGGTCWVAGLDYSAPCVLGLNSVGGWATQAQIDPVDYIGNHLRKMTLGLTAPGMHWAYMYWDPTPEGKWGVFQGTYVNGLRTDFYAFKLPPWPGNGAGADSSTSLSRGDYVKVPITIAAGTTANYARVRFGYAENGSPSSYYCTSRAESCTTEIPTAHTGDPFGFLSETVTRVSCASGCTINIPAISGRTLYYTVDALDGSGILVSSSAPEVLVIP